MRMRSAHVLAIASVWGCPLTAQTQSPVDAGGGEDIDRGGGGARRPTAPSQTTPLRPADIPPMQPFSEWASNRTITLADGSPQQVLAGAIAWPPPTASVAEFDLLPGVVPRSAVAQIRKLLEAAAGKVGADEQPGGGGGGGGGGSGELVFDKDPDSVDMMAGVLPGNPPPSPTPLAPTSRPGPGQRLTGF